MVLASIWQHKGCASEQGLGGDARYMYQRAGYNNARDTELERGAYAASSEREY